VTSPRWAQVVASWSDGTAPALPVGHCAAIEEGRGILGQMLQTARPVRIEDFEEVGGVVAELMRELGIRSGVGGPIIIGGRVWGALTAVWRSDAPPPANAEHRLAAFTELVAYAVQSAQTRMELAASRARLVQASDEARRQIERDLHDGAQQRLVTLTMKLRALEAVPAPPTDGVRSDLEEIAAGLDDVLDDLRETARGLHPVMLSRGGLGPALKALGRRSPVPVELDVRTQERLPEPVEVAAYFVVAEALTNAAKHAHASLVRIEADVLDGDLRVSVQDDGVGGADPALGSGLVGLTDRVEALGGKLTLRSPPVGGTTVRIDLPLSG